MTFHDTGAKIKQYPHRVAKAYCEGMSDRIASVTLPDPYAGTNYTDEYDAYHAGALAAAELEGDTITPAVAGSCVVDFAATIPIQP